MKQLVFLIVELIFISTMAQLPYCLDEFEDLSKTQANSYILKNQIEKRFSRNRLVSTNITQYDSLGRIKDMISVKANGKADTFFKCSYTPAHITKTMFSHNKASFSKHFYFSDSMLLRYFITFPGSNDTISAISFVYNTNGIEYVFKSDILWLSVIYENGLMTKFYSSPDVLDAEWIYCNGQISSCVNYSSESKTNYSYDEQGRLVSVSTDGPFRDRDSTAYQYLPDGSYILSHFKKGAETIRICSSDDLLLQELKLKNDKICTMSKYSYEFY